MNGYLANIGNLIDKKEILLAKIENNIITDKATKKLTITNDIECIDEWTPIAKLAIPMWKNKITKDQKTINGFVAIPVAIK